MKILITGVAGFIGSQLALRLTKSNHQIIGIDNLNEYYDVQLKKNRLNLLADKKNFKFQKIDLTDRNLLHTCFHTEKFDIVVNLAAQAGVRYSIENPEAYIESNLVGFFNILEECRQSNIKNFIFASSSSVYGSNTKQPFSEHDNVDHPISLYAATKKSNEVMAHSYAHLFNLPCTGLRFFTVYGPWGRPDMALFTFTHHILNGQPIEVYNHGQMIRDFTYIDDIIDGICKVIDHPATAANEFLTENPDPAISSAPYRIYNLGNHQPVQLEKFIHAIELATNKKAIKEYRPIQPGDVEATFADIKLMEHELRYHPTTSIDTGVKNFVSWYKDYYSNHPQG